MTDNDPVAVEPDDPRPRRRATMPNAKVEVSVKDMDWGRAAVQRIAELEAELAAARAVTQNDLATHQPDSPFGCATTWGQPVMFRDMGIHVCNRPSPHQGPHLCKCGSESTYRSA